jgi:hypothetical protein
LVVPPCSFIYGKLNNNQGHEKNVVLNYLEKILNFRNMGSMSSGLIYVSLNSSWSELKIQIEVEVN